MGISSHGAILAPNTLKYVSKDKTKQKKKL